MAEFHILAAGKVYRRSRSSETPRAAFHVSVGKICGEMGGNLLVLQRLFGLFKVRKKIRRRRSACCENAKNSRSFCPRHGSGIFGPFSARRENAECKQKLRFPLQSVKSGRGLSRSGCRQGRCVAVSCGLYCFNRIKHQDNFIYHFRLGRKCRKQ